MVVLETSNHNQIKIKIPNLSQELPLSFKAYNQDLKDMDDLCTFETKIKRQNVRHWCVKDQRLYPYQDQDSYRQSGTSSVLQSPKSLLKGNRYPLHL